MNRHTDLVNKLNELHRLMMRLSLSCVTADNKAVVVPVGDWSVLFDLVTEAADLAEQQEDTQP